MSSTKLDIPIYTSVSSFASFSAVSQCSEKTVGNVTKVFTSCEISCIKVVKACGSGGLSTLWLDDVHEAR